MKDSSSNSLSQEQADNFIKAPKYLVSDHQTTKYNFAQLSESVNFDLSDRISEEKYVLDINRRRIELTKNTFQNRVRRDIILVRLDTQDDIRHHKNPDGEKIYGSHIHIYSERYNDKQAYPLTKIGIDDGDNYFEMLLKFLNFCNIRDLNIINDEGLFNDTTG